MLHKRVRKSGWNFRSSMGLDFLVGFSFKDIIFHRTLGFGFSDIGRFFFGQLDNKMILD
jgi:hypothetical protein